MQKLNCAIYVRKSTEKGLELEFNSLHNQEEACRNYILSQAFNGWEYYKTYEDGGISGGTMKRPGLNRMLSDMKKGLIQVVLSYKVDRLSRSIIDFHNMMKEFEKHNCNFVSITQAFDTSTSMGKLTLNMLLSFAQFEREVSSERIRDKIAASKKKGYWTGGSPPLGYDVIDKKLIPNEKEAEQVQFIFEKYLEFKSLIELRDFLDNSLIRTKKWINKSGIQKGGYMFTRSILARLLRSQVYIGRIESKKDGVSFQGRHKPILDRNLLNQVQDLLNKNRNQHKKSYNTKPYLLSNKIVDCSGNVFKNQQSVKNKNHKYRYYSIKGKYLPSGDIDGITLDLFEDLFNHPLDNLIGKPRAIEFKSIDYLSLTPREQGKLIRSMVNRVVYHNNKLTYFIKIDDLKYLKPFQAKNYLNMQSEDVLLSEEKMCTTSIIDVLPILSSSDSKESTNKNIECKIKFPEHQFNLGNPGIRLSKDNDTIIYPAINGGDLIIEKEIRINRHCLTTRYLGKGKKMITIGENNSNLIKALSIACRYEKMARSGLSIKKIAEAETKGQRTIYKYLNLNLLSPNIVNDIMASKTPPHINFQTLLKIASQHPDFNDQERAFYGI